LVSCNSPWTWRGLYQKALWIQNKSGDVQVRINVTLKYNHYCNPQSLRLSDSPRPHLNNTILRCHVHIIRF
jgi:hypothetical protein